MFVQKMPYRTHGHLEEVGGLCLISGGAAKGLDYVCLFEIFEVTREINTVSGSSNSALIRRDCNA